MSNYNIHVAERNFVIKTEDLATFDMHQTVTDDYHVLMNNKVFDVQLITKNFFEKTIILSVNGNSYTVKIDDEYDIMVAEMGLLANIVAKFNAIKAPMPGLIIDVMVKAGDTIEIGTPLIVLSAMKMENIILSEGEGVIKSIEVKIDDAVDKGQLIIEMED